MIKLYKHNVPWRCIVDKKDYEYYKSLLQKMTLMDDTFMRIVLKKEECSELLLRIILEKDDLKIEKLQIQNTLDESLTKSVIMDVLVTDKDGTLYNIEVQRADSGARPKRARYNSSILDTHILEKGQDTEELPKTYIIFITQNDVLRKDKMIYHIKRTISETGEEFGDESNIIYVNTSKQDDTALGKLIYNLKCENPKYMNYEVLKKECEIHKNDEVEVRNMCKIMEDLRILGQEEGKIEGKIEGRIEALIETTKNLLNMNLSIEDIMKATGLSRESILELKK